MSADQTAVTLRSGGKTVELSETEMDALAAKLAEQQNRPGIPITGKFLNTILKQVCYKRHKDEPERNVSSIAVGDLTIAATDGRQAIIVGPTPEEEDLYMSTDRKSALLEAARESIYGDFVFFGNIERMVTDSGESVPFPKLESVMKKLDNMDVIATLRPDLLLSAAKLAVDSGASYITLHQPNESDSMLGFTFHFIPEEQLDLFNNNMTEVPVRGLVCTRSSKGQVAKDEEEGGEE